MQTQHLIAGTPEWHAHRAQHFNASDAPAMLGCSPYKSRAALLRQMATGLAAEHDAATERRFADGHRFEALARPLAEQIIGDDLAPVVGVLEGTKLSASFDGLTLMGDTAFEHKTLNDDLRGCMRDEGNGYDLPKHYRAQMEQQLLVSGADRVLFMASKWDGDTMLEERHCWYASDPALRAEIVAGWRQFEQDLAAYTPPAAASAAPTGHAPETLPALRIEISGAVTASNLAEFKATALGAIRSVNRDLTTDQQFADAEQAVKWCGEVESRIKAAKEHALSQTASIDQLFKTLDDVSAEARKVRLDLEKLVDRRKVEIKCELVAQAKAAYEAHETACRQDAGAWQLLAPPDFTAAIKGKRSVDSMRDALDACLSNAKIAASEQARKIRANLAALDEESRGAEHLFRDRLTFIGLTPEAVRLMVRQRIAEHQAAEERRAAELAERERARIRAEEEARAAEKVRQEQAAREAEERRQRAAAEEAERQRVAAADAELRAAQANPEGTDLSPAAQALNEQEGAARFAAAHPSLAPAANVVPMPTKAPAEPQQATLNLGAINTRLGFTMNADFVRRLGIELAATEKAAKLYTEHQFSLICEALVAHVRTVAHQQQKVA